MAKSKRVNFNPKEEYSIMNLLDNVYLPDLEKRQIRDSEALQILKIIN